MGADVGTTAAIAVRLTPRGGRDAITGLDEDDVLHVRVAAPPADGAANAALVRLLARSARVPRSAISVVSGERSRTKRVAVSGISDATLRERLSA